jgi:AcrR family transcriptional regulator
MATLTAFRCGDGPMSPAALLTHDDATERLLATASDLFYRRGVGAVTMAAVRDASGVSLRRIYALYPTKADLVTAWLTRRHETWSEWFGSSIAERSSDVTVVDAIFDALAEWLTATDHRGCAFINTLAETDVLTAEHRSVIELHKQQLVGTIAEHVDDAEAIAVLVDGAIVQSAIFHTTAPVEAARRAAQAVVSTTPPNQLMPMSGARS